MLRRRLVEVTGPALYGKIRTNLTPRDCLPAHTDAQHGKSVHVAGGFVHEDWLEHADREGRQVGRILRRLDSRQKVPGRHGRVRGQREIPIRGEYV